MTTTNTDESATIEQELRQFTGDLERTRHGLNRQVIYTPGIEHLAERCGAYWLIDEIALAQLDPRLNGENWMDVRLKEMQFWTLTVEDAKGLLICQADAGEKPTYRKRIPFTDFPLPKIVIWAAFDGRHWTLYLPSEH